MEQVKDDNTIKALFETSKNQRKNLESIAETNSASYQQIVQAAIATLEECRNLAIRISLFSPNETEDDITSSNLQYLLIDFYLAELVLKDSSSARTSALYKAQEAYEKFLCWLDNYGILSKVNSELYKRYIDDRDGFSLISESNPAIVRKNKIDRFKDEKQLKSKIEYLSLNPSTLQNDDAALRSLYFAQLHLSTHYAFHALDLISQEFKILSLAPSNPTSSPQDPTLDDRLRTSQQSETYSDRLDPPLATLLQNGKAGPILSKEGRPLQPFTLLDSRQRLRDGVFRPSHRLPTMTIDEYLAEEKRRGGIIENQGGQNPLPSNLDEDDFEVADKETMKARQWDEFKEENPKGSGNTINRG